MPRPWIRLAILIFWVVMMGWLFRRDVLPALGLGETTYRGLLADRAIERTNRWILSVDGADIGTVVTSILPQPRGGYLLETRANLMLPLPGLLDADEARILCSGEIAVDPLGRLEEIHSRIEVGGGPHMELMGVVAGDRLSVRVDGLPDLFEKEWSLRIDPTVPVLDKLGPIDRLPGLMIGKRWTSRSLDPMSVLVFPRPWASGRATLGVVQHEVVAEENLDWSGREVPCWLVEHRQHGRVARTWARKPDGTVLHTQILFGQTVVEMRLDPIDSRD